jgi:hypothetical protein
VRDFPIRKSVDNDGDVLEEDNVNIRFKTTRTRDHMMVPFQSETWPFCNIMLWDPGQNSANGLEMMDMMR